MPRGPNKADLIPPRDAPINSRDQRSIKTRAIRGVNRDLTRTRRRSGQPLEASRDIARRGKTQVLKSSVRGVRTYHPVTKQSKEGTKTNPPKKVPKGKKSLATRILRKVGIKRKGQE